MCGVGFVVQVPLEGEIFPESDFPLPSFDTLAAPLSRRGPDALRSEEIEIPDSPFRIGVIATVLFVREQVIQPLHDKETGNVFWWNGEIFRGTLAEPLEGNDSQRLLLALRESSPLTLWPSLGGPWVMVLWQPSLRRLWFGRSIVGQRSFLLRRSPEGLMGTSIAPLDPPGTSPSSQEGWLEMPPGIYSLTFSATSARLESHRRFSLEELGSRPMGIPPERIPPSPSLSAVEGLLLRLRESVRVRVTALPPARSPSSSRLSVLFSGGIDSLLLARLADEFVPLDDPIDLLNVSFAEPSQSSDTFDTFDAFDVPDRLTGRAGWETLCSLSKRRWRFVAVNVSAVDIRENWKDIAQAVQPQSTVMDVTIGTALWFAVRGEGLLLDPMGGSQPYVSQGKIVLDGLGADELCGGYTRHRKVFGKDKNWKALQEELTNDTNRLWERNLGRDDRLLSDHGKEVRFPFLDEEVITFVQSLPLWDICNLAEPPGVGDKKILREIARRVELGPGASLSKRAIQFGSRINKVLFPRTPASKIDGKSLFSWSDFLQDTQ